MAVSKLLDIDTEPFRIPKLLHLDTERWANNFEIIRFQAPFFIFERLHQKQSEKPLRITPLIQEEKFNNWKNGVFSQNKTDQRIPEAAHIIFQYIQLQHHIGKWTSLPSPILRDLRQVFHNIRPACIDKEYNQFKEDYIKDISLNIRNKTLHHFHCHVADIETKLEHLEDINLEASILQARHLLKKKLDQRIAPEFINTQVNIIRGIIKNSKGNSMDIDPPIPPGTPKPPPPKQPPLPTTASKRRHSLSPEDAPPRRELRYFSPPPSPIAQPLETTPDLVSFETPSSKTFSTSQITTIPATSLITPLKPVTSTPITSKSNSLITPFKTTTATPTTTTTALSAPAPSTQPSTNSFKSPSSITTPSPRLPSTKRTRGCAFVHNSKNKDLWKCQVEADSSVILVGSSNARFTRNLPLFWQADAYPGIGLQHIPHLLSTLEPTRENSTLIISVGMNNRDNATTRVLKLYEGIQEALEKHNIYKKFGKIFWNQVAIPKHLDKDTRDILRFINQQSKCLKNTSSIPAIDYTEIGLLRPNDIHYNQDTVDRITIGIINFVSNSEPKN